MTALNAEWKLTARDPLFRVAVVLLTLLTLLCLWNGARFETARAVEAASEMQRSLDKRIADRETLQREEAGVTPLSPWGPSEPTRAEAAVIRPPGALASLSFGQEDIHPLAGSVSLWMTRADNLFRKYEFGSPLTLAAGRFDAGFLVVLLLPLFALALAFNVLADERASARLNFAAVTGAVGSYGRRLVLRMALRSTPLLICVVLIGAVSLIRGAPAGALFLWLLAATLYLVFWAGLATVIGSLRRPAQAIALTGTAVWLIVVVLTPALAASAAHSLSPPPTEFSRIVAVRTAEKEANSHLLPNLLTYAAGNPDLAAITYTDEDWSAKLYVSQLEVERDIEDVLQRIANARLNRERWLTRLSLASPAAVVDALLTEIAGTGTRRQVAFESRSEAFLDQWRIRYAPMIFARERLKAADIEHLPTFEFAEPGIPMTQVFGWLLYLVLLALIVATMAWRRLTRSDE